MIYYFIVNKEQTKCCHVNEHGVIDYENIDHDLQLTELENLPNNVLVNPELYLNNNFIIGKLLFKFVVPTLIELRRMVKVMELYSFNLQNKKSI